MILIAVFSTLRLRTLCTFSHEPPHMYLSLSLSLSLRRHLLDNRYRRCLQGLGSLRHG